MESKAQLAAAKQYLGIASKHLSTWERTESAQKSRCYLSISVCVCACVWNSTCNSGVTHRWRRWYGLSNKLPHLAQLQIQSKQNTEKWTFKWDVFKSTAVNAERAQVDAGGCGQLLTILVSMTAAAFCKKLITVTSSSSNMFPNIPVDVGMSQSAVCAQQTATASEATLLLLEQYAMSVAHALSWQCQHTLNLMRYLIAAQAAVVSQRNTATHSTRTQSRFASPKTDLISSSSSTSLVRECCCCCCFADRISKAWFHRSKISDPCSHWSVDSNLKAWYWA
jgi:hypothetical protein